MPTIGAFTHLLLLGRIRLKHDYHDGLVSVRLEVSEDASDVPAAFRTTTWTFDQEALSIAANYLDLVRAERRGTPPVREADGSPSASSQPGVAATSANPPGQTE